MVHYRSFRNTDPPGLVEIWKEAFTGRGAVRLRNASPLEQFVFSKPYFDPGGLVVATDNEVQVGFAHAGFGPNADQSALSHVAGVTCVIGVRTSHRRQGIGSELLKRCEAYLQAAGATGYFAGPMPPLIPFYMGLYGGSDMAGFLTSDVAAGPFFKAHGYQPWQTRLIFQRRLDQAVNVTDGRFALLRRRFDLQVVPKLGATSWWSECATGPIEFLEFRLMEKATARWAARADIWEMENFSWSWGVPSVGVRNIEVRDELRRQGLAKFLVAHILRAMQEQYFGLVELQVTDGNQPGINLCASVGFQKVDYGLSFRRDAADSPATTAAPSS